VDNFARDVMLMMASQIDNSVMLFPSALERPGITRYNLNSEAMVFEDTVGWVSDESIQVHDDNVPLSFQTENSGEKTRADNLKRSIERDNGASGERFGKMRGWICNLESDRLNSPAFRQFAASVAERAESLRRVLEAVDSNAGAYAISIQAARDAVNKAAALPDDSEDRKKYRRQFDAAKSALKEAYKRAHIRIAGLAREIRWQGKQAGLLALFGENYYYEELTTGYNERNEYGFWDEIYLKERSAYWNPFDFGAQRNTEFFYNDLILANSLALRESILSIQALTNFLDKQDSQENSKTERKSISAAKAALLEYLPKPTSPPKDASDGGAGAKASPKSETPRTSEPITNDKPTVVKPANPSEKTSKADVSNGGVGETVAPTPELPSFTNDKATEVEQSIHGVSERLKDLDHLDARYVPIKSTSAYLGLAQMRTQLDGTQWGAGPGNNQWEPVTTVSVVGSPASKTVFVVMRDHLGNWQVKQTLNDPSAMLAAVQNGSLNLLELMLQGQLAGAAALKQTMLDTLKSGPNGQDHLNQMLDLIDAELTTINATRASKEANDDTKQAAEKRRAEITNLLQELQQYLKKQSK
jgi:hypothetical protein